MSTPAPVRAVRAVPGADPVGPGAPPRLRPPRWLPVLAWAVFGLVIGFLMVRYRTNPPYSPDSWGYFELSRHVGADFFRVNTYRNYQSPHPYGASFGPAWPLVIWASGAVTRAGAYAGFIAAFGALIGTAAAVEAFGRRMASVRGLGPTVALGLLAFPPYVDEVLAARSFPLAILLLCLLLWALSAVPDRGTPAAVAAGAAAAGLVLTRADALFAVLPLVLLLIVARRLAPRTKPWRLVPWRPVLAGVAVFAALLAPWAAYGLAHFGTPLVSDNTIIASAVQRHFITDVIDTERTATVRDDPLGWLARITGNAPAVVGSWKEALATAPIVVLTGLVGLLLWLRGRGDAPPGTRLLLAALGCFFAQLTVAELTTAYLDHRYLAPAVLLVVLVAVALLLSGRVPRSLSGRRAGAVVALALVLLPATATIGHHVWRVPVRAGSLDGGALGRELARCHDGASTLVVGGTDGVLPARHGARDGKPSGFYPGNMARLSLDERREWVRAYRIGLFYLPPAGRNRVAAERMTRERALLAEAVTLIPDPCARLGRLYRVSPGDAGRGVEGSPG